MSFSPKSIKIVDVLIPVFFSIFLATLTNSIFLNQIGYFGTLFLLLVRLGLSKENPFQRTSLDFPFLFYLTILFLSSLFSIDPSSSLENLLKRVLLIPVFYTTLSYCNSVDRLQKTVKLFFIFVIVSITVYIFFALIHYVNNLYGLEQSGPGIFHYPITTSEIMGFIVVIFFALFIDYRSAEKVLPANKISTLENPSDLNNIDFRFSKKFPVRWDKYLYFSLFALSTVALISTYKRTGWIGAIAGILYVIIMNRRYYLLVIFSVLISIAVLLESDKSSVTIMEIPKNHSSINTDHQLQKNQNNGIISFTTDGKAHDILPLQKEDFYKTNKLDSKKEIRFILSDYSNGLSIYDSSKIIKHLPTVPPAIRTIRYDDSVFIVYHTDTRFSLIKITNSLNPETDRNGSPSSKSNPPVSKESDIISEPQSAQKNVGYQVIRELVSPGFTHDFKTFDPQNGNGILFYVLDKDSGLTVFSNILSNPEMSTYKFEIEYEKFMVDSQYFILFKPHNLVSIYSRENGELNFHKSPAYTFDTDAGMMYYDSGFLYLTSSNGLQLFEIGDTTLTLISEENRINSVNFIDRNSEMIFLGKATGEVFGINRIVKKSEIINKDEAPLRTQEKINHKLTYQLYSIGTPIHSMFVDEHRIYTTYQRTNKFKSIIDPFNQSNATRLQLWEAGLKIALDYPFFGVGDIDLASVYAKYKVKYAKEIQGHLHNNFFHILATLGFSGIIVFIFLLVSIVIRNASIYKEIKKHSFAFPRYNSLSLGINGAFISFIVSGLTEWNFGDHEIITMVWFLIGLNFAILKIVKRHQNIEYKESVDIDQLTSKKVN